jgi:hypothetical protein
MYESLKANSSDFHLFIFAFDDLSSEILKRMSLTSATVIPIRDLESPELLAIKETRTKAEYCWTCTPSVISYSIEEYNLPKCTYIDADLFFYSDPAVLIGEMLANRKTILITEHRFSLLPGWYSLKRAGRFCVQFLTISNDQQSMVILDTWKRQCINWCYAKYEDGKFGDQKYLNEWPNNYSNVHILNHPGGGLAPWNIQQYLFTTDENKITGLQRKDGKKFDVIFYHFQYVKIISEGVFDIGWYYIPETIKEIFYRQYLKKIMETEHSLNAMENGYKINFVINRSDRIWDKMKHTYKKITKYNILKII